jgi:hypothetical protein
LYEVVRATRKRLQSQKLKVVLLALNLIETLVKNCHMDFHKAVSNEKFMNIMARLVEVCSYRLLTISSQQCLIIFLATHNEDT